MTLEHEVTTKDEIKISVVDRNRRMLVRVPLPVDPKVFRARVFEAVEALNALPL